MSPMKPGFRIDVSHDFAPFVPRCGAAILQEAVDERYGLGPAHERMSGADDAHFVRRVVVARLWPVTRGSARRCCAARARKTSVRLSGEMPMAVEVASKSPSSAEPGTKSRWCSSIVRRMEAARSRSIDAALAASSLARASRRGRASSVASSKAFSPRGRPDECIGLAE